MRLAAICDLLFLCFCTCLHRHGAQRSLHIIWIKRQRTVKGTPWRAATWTTRSGNGMVNVSLDSSVLSFLLLCFLPDVAGGRAFQYQERWRTEHSKAHQPPSFHLL